MADIALYRKYRPQNFENLVGQEAVQRTLLNAIKAGHLSHAYLFCGPRGTGKTTTARLVAKAINCISPEPSGESCNKCEYCLSMNEGRLVDVIEIDAASNRGIDEIRDLREKIKFSPTQAPHKIYIIDEVHMLTTPAFNALLKTLEEPPSHAYFILATTEAHKLPDTILSRCQRFDFHRLEESTIIERLRAIARLEDVAVEEDALSLIARAAEGGMRDAISLFEQLMSGGRVTLQNTLDILGLSGRDAVRGLFVALEAHDLKTALHSIQTLHREGHDLHQFQREFLEWLRLQMLDSLSKKETLSRLLHWIELFQEAGKQLRNAVIPHLPLEMAVIQCILPPEESKTGWFSGLMSSKKGEAKEGLKPIPNEIDARASKTASPASSPEEVQSSVAASSSSEALPPEFTLENVQHHLPRILEHIRTPSLRHSFKTGWIKSVEDRRVLVEFQSKFHLGKVDHALGKSEIEKAFAPIFGITPKVSFQLSESTQLVDTTLEIFGGEVVE